MQEWVPLTQITASAARNPKLVTLKPTAAKPVAAAAPVAVPAVVNPYAAPKAGPAQASAALGSVPYPVLQELRGTGRG